MRWQHDYPLTRWLSRNDKLVMGEWCTWCPLAKLFTHKNSRHHTLPNIPKNPARLRERVEPLDIVLRSDSTRIADRDLARTFDDDGGDSPTEPATPE